jgi:hypothetical protein
MTKFNKLNCKILSKPTPSLFDLYRVVSSPQTVFYHYSTIFKSYFTVFQVKCSLNAVLFYQTYRTPNLFNFFSVFYLKNKIQPKTRTKSNSLTTQSQPSPNLKHSKNLSRYWFKTVASLKKIHSLLSLSFSTHKLNFLMNKKKIQPISYFMKFPTENFFYIKKLTNVDLSYNKKVITLKQTFNNYSKFQRLLSFYENDLSVENLYRTIVFKTQKRILKKKHYKD